MTNDLTGGDKQFRDAWASMFLLVMLFSAVFFPFRDYGHRNIIVSCVAGFVIGSVPWMAPEHVLAAADVVLGGNYPRPIVDHAIARRDALSAFRALRSGKERA